jgi:glycosyltransferase involved in cell wall biosynthesis
VVTGLPGSAVARGTELAVWTRPWHVLVVVPARNEEAVLAGCLRSVRSAAWQVRLARPGVRVDVVTVLDSCTDGTADVLAGFPEVRGLTVTHGGVGAARAAGVLTAAATAGADTDHVWLASTDADSEVPPDWLTLQLERADRGAHAVVGTVRPARSAEASRPARLGPVPSTEQLVRWHARHTVHDGHPHVHGANLGVRLDRYLAVGGFDPLEEHEDVRLVERLAASDAVVVRTSAGRVRTSDRLEGRTPGGFAAYLRRLRGVA